MSALQKSIEILGSQRLLAESIGVSPQTIWAWIDRGSLIPPEKCVLIERVTDRAVTRQDLRPDDWKQIWPELSEVG